MLVDVISVSTDMVLYLAIWFYTVIKTLSVIRVVLYGSHKFTVRNNHRD